MSQCPGARLCISVIRYGSDIFIIIMFIIQNRESPAVSCKTSSPVTRKSVKIRRQQQQKLTGLLEAASEGRKGRLQASLHKHNTVAPFKTPSMATTTQNTHVIVSKALASGWRSSGMPLKPQTLEDICESRNPLNNIHVYTH